jgi:hypothetical protein
MSLLIYLSDIQVYIQIQCLEDQTEIDVNKSDQTQAEGGQGRDEANNTPRMWAPALIACARPHRAPALLTCCAGPQRLPTTTGHSSQQTKTEMEEAQRALPLSSLEFAPSQKS